MKLIEAVADALGVDVATVVTHDRNLVAAGMRSKGGRGKSAAKMMTSDAVNLLIAVAGSEQVRGSVEAVEGFGSLVSAGSLFRPLLPDLRAGHHFQDALTAIIDGFGSANFRCAGEIFMDIEMIRPRLTASISIEADGQAGKAMYLPASDGAHDPPKTGDLQMIARFSSATLWQLSDLLRG